MNRETALVVQIVDNTSKGFKEFFRGWIEKGWVELAQFKNHRGRFIMWIEPDKVTPEVMQFKDDFNIVPNEQGMIPLRLWHKITKEEITVNNYMEMDWSEMTDIAPIVEETLI